MKRRITIAVSTGTLLVALGIPSVEVIAQDQPTQAVGAPGPVEGTKVDTSSTTGDRTVRFDKLVSPSITGGGSPPDMGNKSGESHGTIGITVAPGSTPADKTPATNFTPLNPPEPVHAQPSLPTATPAAPVKGRTGPEPGGGRGGEGSGGRGGGSGVRGGETGPDHPGRPDGTVIG